MKFILPIFLCLFCALSECSDNVILYFSVYKEPASRLIAATLNDFTNGIALHIPVNYIKNAALVTALVYSLVLLYRYRRTIQLPKECMCDHCLDLLQEKAQF